jgi:hypothetical protein
MLRDLALEPQLHTVDIQGDILPGLLKRHENLIFFRIDDAAAFKKFVAELPITTMQHVLDQRQLIADRKAAGIEALVPAPGLNVAFSYAGLLKMDVPGLDAAAGIEEFRGGMASRTAVLADPPASEWSVLGPGAGIDGVFILTGATPTEIEDTIALHLAPTGSNGWYPVHEEIGLVRPDPERGHEHFGYADGVSQPGVRGVLPDGTPLTVSVDPAGHTQQGTLGQDLLWPGSPSATGSPWMTQEPASRSRRWKRPIRRMSSTRTCSRT